jgi:uncharacterized membrane protein YkoI
MKRKLVIATLTATALIGTGTVSAVALADDGDQRSAQVASASPTAGDDDGNDDRDRDDRDDRTDDDRDRRDDDFAPSGLKISAADAAVKGSTKGTVTSVDLDDDGSGLSWEVKTTDGNGVEHEYLVDAESGKLTEQPADHDRDDDSRYDDDRRDGDDDRYSDDRDDDDRHGHGRHGGDDDRDDDHGGHGRHGGDDDRHGDDD